MHLCSLTQPPTGHFPYHLHCEANRLCRYQGYLREPCGSDTYERSKIHSSHQFAVTLKCPLLAGYLLVVPSCFGLLTSGLDWVEFREGWTGQSSGWLSHLEHLIQHVGSSHFHTQHCLSHCLIRIAHTCVMPPLHFKFLYRQRSYLLRLCVHFTRALEIIHKWYSLNTYAFQAVLDRSQMSAKYSTLLKYYPT